MSIEIKQVKSESFSDYCKIKMQVKVESIFELNILNNGLGGILLNEKAVEPYIYDPSYGDDPLSWGEEFNIDNWGFFIAYDDEKPVGGIALAFNTKGVNMLANRDDLTVVWDVRVSEEYKLKGIGSKLFELAEKWAQDRNCTQMKVETQNCNVKACKFYEKQKFILGEINRFAYYGDLDDEVMLVWYKNLNYNSKETL